MTDPRRALPGVDRVLASDAGRALLERFPRDEVVATVRHVLDDVRAHLDAGTPPNLDVICSRAARALAARREPSLRPVLNATGVILHTNLGRAPLSERARQRATEAAQGYSNLEFDLEAGERGSRYDHCAALLATLSGAEAALVVNNAAGGLVLALAALGGGAGVAVSRGEMIEIGGGFRIPDIVTRAGSALVEVGTTNRTRLDDYRRAVAEGGVGVLLKVHRSNFRLSGFTEDAPLEDLVALGAEVGTPVVHDLGSGLLVDLSGRGLGPEPEAEPRVQQSVAVGADVVVASGDKLLGGPQAGIVVGRTGAVARLRAHPLCRALRVDKVTLAALEGTLLTYLDGTAFEDIPVLRMLTARLTGLEARARALAGRLAEAGVEAVAEPGAGAVGGGTLPGVEIPSWTVRLTPAEAPDGGSAHGLARRLRLGVPAVVGRVEHERVVLDLRTIPPETDPALERCVLRAFEGDSGGD